MRRALSTSVVLSLSLSFTAQAGKPEAAKPAAGSYVKAVKGGLAEAGLTAVTVMSYLHWPSYALTRQAGLAAYRKQPVRSCCLRVAAGGAFVAETVALPIGLTLAAQGDPFWPTVAVAGVTAVTTKLSFRQPSQLIYGEPEEKGGPKPLSKMALTATERLAVKTATEAPCKAGGEAACASRFMSTLGERAFGRPLRRREIAELNALYKEAGSFRGGLEKVALAILRSPKFVDRVRVGKPEYREAGWFSSYQDEFHTSRLIEGPARDMAKAKKIPLEAARAEASAQLEFDYATSQLMELTQMNQAQLEQLVGAEAQKLSADTGMDPTSAKVAVTMARLEAAQLDAVEKSMARVIAPTAPKPKNAFQRADELTSPSYWLRRGKNQE